jgi:hypothetical protein
MSSNYCIALNVSPFVGLPVISLMTANPVNFSSFQFSVSTNSFTIFLFSKYPFNFGYGGVFCVNQDAFGFSEVGQNFNIDLSNYQGYYMLILIYPQGVNFNNYGPCGTVSGLTMTFQNTTITPIENATINSNFDAKGETGFCSCTNIQSMVASASCSNITLYSTVSLDNLNNELVITTCQAFIIQNNTTVGFVTPHTCSTFGAILTTPIPFSANSQVIDFLNNNKISYFTLSPTMCQQTANMVPCTLPCKSFYQISQLLSPPLKYSLITSKLWNEIVSDLYLAYSVYKYINYLSQFPYIQNIYHTIADFYNFYENFQPYPFTPLIHAVKGLPLTVDYFNNLVDAIIKLANLGSIQLQRKLSHVQTDEIVKALQFDRIVYNVNQLLTFNKNQYFILSCSGNEFANLLNSIPTFLNVLISQSTLNITIPNTTYIKNLLVYNNPETFTIYGLIDKFILNINSGTIQLNDSSYIRSLVLVANQGTIELNGQSNITNFIINQNPGIIILNNNSIINTMQIEYNIGQININDNVIIENLICVESSGFIYLSPTATIINNQCGPTTTESSSSVSIA